MAPRATVAPPTEEVLLPLFRACEEALRHEARGWLTPAKKYHALVILGVVRRDELVTQRSLSEAFGEVAAALQRGECPPLLSWLGLGGDPADLVDTLVVPAHAQAVQAQGSRVYTDKSFIQQFSRHVNRLLAAASFLMPGPGGGAVTVYKLHLVSTDPLAFGIRGAPEGKGDVKAAEDARAIAGAARAGPNAPEVKKDWPPPPTALEVAYCQFTEKFRSKHRESVTVVDDECPLTLYYVFFRVRSFHVARDLIRTVINDRRRRRTYDDGRLADVGVWSTLGAVDLVLRFRTSSDAAAASLYDELRRRLLGGHALKDSVEPNPVMVRADAEFINGLFATPPTTFFYRARKQHLEHASMSVYRYATFFILFRYTQTPFSLDDSIASVLAVLEVKGNDADLEFLHIVEAITAARAHGEASANWLVLEGQIPCGMLPLLLKLSVKLETQVSDGQGAKETLIAYDLVGQYHDAPPA